MIVILNARAGTAAKSGNLQSEDRGIVLRGWPEC